MTLQVGLVGLGNAGRDLHVPVIREHPDLELRAVCDMDERRLEEVTASSPTTGYTEVEGMLDTEPIDVVHIATPPQTHLDVARHAFERGLPTLLEKPLATTVSDAEEMMRLSEEHDALACVVHNQQFWEPVQRALRSVNSGRVGEVVSVTMLHGDQQNLAESNRGEWVLDLPGGELGEGLPHQVYLPLAFAGSIDEIVNVSWYDSDAGSPYGFDGVTVEIVDDELGIPINIKILKNTVSENLLVVHCHDVEFRVDLDTRSLYTNRMKEVNIKTIGLSNLRMVYEIAKNGLINLVSTGGRAIDRARDEGIDEYAVGHYALVDEFVAAIRTGGPAPVPLEEGRDTVEIMQAVDS